MIAEIATSGPIACRIWVLPGLATVTFTAGIVSLSVKLHAEGGLLICRPGTGRGGDGR